MRGHDLAAVLVHDTVVRSARRQFEFDDVLLSRRVRLVEAAELAGQTVGRLLGLELWARRLHPDDVDEAPHRRMMARVSCLHQGELAGSVSALMAHRIVVRNQLSSVSFRLRCWYDLKCSHEPGARIPIHDGYCRGSDQRAYDGAHDEDAEGLHGLSPGLSRDSSGPAGRMLPGRHTVAHSQAFSVALGSTSSVRPRYRSAI